MTMQSFPSHLADYRLRGVAALIALAAALLIGEVVVWYLVITLFDAVPQSVGQAGIAVAIVNPLIVGGSTLLLLLLLVSATFLWTGRRGAFMETISLFFVFSFLAVAGDMLTWVFGAVAHVSGDLIAPVAQRQSDLADAISNIAFLFVALHVGAACVGMIARRNARDIGPGLPSSPLATQSSRATSIQQASPAAQPLSDGDKALIRDFLHRRDSLELARRDRLAMLLATAIHSRVGGEPPSAPEAYLERLATLYGL
jgi:hypothetical protein